MAAQEERIAVLETMVNEHLLTHVEFRNSMIRLDQRMDGMQQRTDARLDRVDDRFTSLDDKMSRQFLWTIGIQITVLVAVVGSLLGLLAIAAPR